MVNIPQRKVSLQVNDFGVDEIFSDEIQYLPSPPRRANANSLTIVPPLPSDINVIAGDVAEVVTKRREDGANEERNKEIARECKSCVITVTVDVHAAFSDESTVVTRAAVEND